MSRRSVHAQIAVRRPLDSKLCKSSDCLSGAKSGTALLLAEASTVSSQSCHTRLDCPSCFAVLPPWRLDTFPISSFARLCCQQRFFAAPTPPRFIGGLFFSMQEAHFQGVDWSRPPAHALRDPLQFPRVSTHPAVAMAWVPSAF